jgi:hypothetical protein
MEGTLNALTNDATAAKVGPEVRAASIQDDDAAILGAVRRELLSEYPTRNRTVTELTRKAEDVPRRRIRHERRDRRDIEARCPA